MWWEEMSKEEFELYFKDLKVSIQRKLKAWYTKHAVTGLEDIYNNKIPLDIFMVFDDGDLEPATDHSDEMVI